MDNGYKQIEPLLERFFEGATSNEEEQRLYAFFSQEEVPEHLERYKAVFAYFEAELPGEIREQPDEPATPPRHIRRRHRLGRWGSVAAVALVLLSIPFLKDRISPFDPYEGSYIIRNGERITDMERIRPELEATVRLALQQEKKADDLLLSLTEQERQHNLAGQQIEQQFDQLLNGIQDEYVKNEIRKIVYR